MTHGREESDKMHGDQDHNLVDRPLPHFEGLEPFAQVVRKRSALDLTMKLAMDFWGCAKKVEPAADSDANSLPPG